MNFWIQCKPGGDVVALGIDMKVLTCVYPPRYTLLNTLTHKLDDDVTVFSLHMPSNHTPYPPRHNPPDTHIQLPDRDLVAFGA